MQKRHILLLSNLHAFVAMLDIFFIIKGTSHRVINDLKPFIHLTFINLFCYNSLPQ